MTQVAHGLDPDGLLLLDVVVSGVVPKSLADADLQVQVGAQPRACRWGGFENGMCHPHHTLAARPPFLPDTQPGQGQGQVCLGHRVGGRGGPSLSGTVFCPFHK